MTRPSGVRRRCNGCSNPLLKQASEKSLDEARERAKKGWGWGMRLSFIEGNSAKFWKASGEYTGEPDPNLENPVLIVWGRVGTKGRSLIKDWAYLEKVYPVKIRKGYKHSWWRNDVDKLRDILNRKNVGAVPPEDLKVISVYANTYIALAEKKLKRAVTQEFPKQIKALTEFGGKHNVPVEDIRRKFERAQKLWHKGVRDDIDKVKRTLRRMNVKTASGTPLKVAKGRGKQEAQSLVSLLFGNWDINHKRAWEGLGDDTYSTLGNSTFYDLMEGDDQEVSSKESPSSNLAKHVFNELYEIGGDQDLFYPVWRIFQDRLWEHGFKV